MLGKINLVTDRTLGSLALMKSPSHAQPLYEGHTLGFFTHEKSDRAQT